MIKKILYVLFILFLILLIVPVHADDLNNGSDILFDKFSDLNQKLNDSKSYVEFNESYQFNSSSDDAYKNGVVISKNLTVNGNNHFIDANHKARCLIIKSNCSVVLENITFLNGYSPYGAGAIMLQINSSLILKNCIFKNNKVYNSDGGALCCGKHSYTEIINCLFENNTSVRESSLEWKEFKSGMGSAVCIGRGSTLKMENSIFKSNSAYLSTILVVSFDDVVNELSSLYVKNCLFENNTSISNGVIYLDELGRGVITDSVFRKNRVIESAGTLILDASVSALVKNCLFDQNSAVKGGAIHIKVFDYSYRSNVTIDSCNFTKNTASVWGGAISSKYGLANILNCRFIENTAKEYGGAIYAKLSTLTLKNLFFDENSAPYGGALFIKESKSVVENCMFKKNTATSKGGAVYSKDLTVSSDNCSYISNSALKGLNVYGAFYAQITQISSYYDDVYISVKISSPWKLSLSQKIKVKFTNKKSYKTGWLKTDSNGYLKFKAPRNMNLGKYSLSVTMENGVCYINSIKINVVKAPVKLKVKKLSTSYKSKKLFKAYVTNSRTGKSVSNVKVKLKIYTGKSYTVHTVKSDKNGMIKFDTSKLSVGKHHVKISSDDKNIKLKKVGSQIKIRKISAKVVYPKKVRKSSKIIFAVKNGENGKVIKKCKLDVKIYTGKSYKSYKVKTNLKGEFKISAKKLTKSKHKILITKKSGNYRINNKMYIRCI